MAYRRSISWSYALQGLRADRDQISKAGRRAALAASAFAKLAFRRAQALDRVAPLVVCGTYNRTAIMGAATRAAKARCAVTGEAWRVCVSAALCGVWQAAKAARRQVTSRKQYHLERLREEVGVHALQVTKAVRGEANGSQSLEDSSPAPPKHVTSEPGARGGFCATEQAQAFPDRTGSAPARR